ncbi:MAG: sigma-70 family RNA polymerase sigma factor, partial [Gemmatimonadetes bacterium]|nr:sigma-70 family RNA polymerase sigma factor [Gemmatimonadota bacterium]
MEDSQLLAKVRAGDPAAERALYDAHVDRVYRLAYRMTGDDALAQDFTQEAFIRAFNKLHTFRGDSALSTWMHTVTTSVVLNGLRKVKKFRKSEIDLEKARAVSGESSRAEPDLRDRLRQAVHGLAKPILQVGLGAAAAAGR